MVICYSLSSSFITFIRVRAERIPIPVLHQGPGRSSNFMSDYLKQLADDIKRKLQEQSEKHKNEVVDIQQYQRELKYLSDFSWDTIQTIRTVSIYSTRGNEIYDKFLFIRSLNDLLQSIVGLKELISNGVHNFARREIRYLIEMSVKYSIVDQEKMGEPLNIKTQYLTDNIPNSSIEVVDRLSTPFEQSIDKEFKDEIKDIFYKACAYVHPSQRQIEEQLANYSKGVNIGFETTKMLSDINKIAFRAYDIILTLLFINFGQSMSGDIFIQVYDDEPKWKFHKGKYIKHYSKLFDYKSERRNKK